MATLTLSYKFDQQGFMNDRDFYSNDPEVHVARTADTYTLEFVMYDETTRTVDTIDGVIHLNDLAETALDYRVSNRIA